ncbi:hypothetical protein EPR50_G00008890 [Perca flavescens]|uniref:ZP domain-containing protein n=2 Tax=Perca flavescens TaxID=8167 RepID=A0A484DQQ4_PERFV|nr:hypothetical protein EPR50_G00008890 [Perca flavescens]
MASLTVLLLHLLLMLSSASAWYYSYYGGSLTFTPKGQYSDGTYKVELHNKQTTIYCNLNYYSCSSGDCGTQTETTSTGFYSNSMGFYWCQYDTVNKINLNSNLPFEIRYPTNVSPYIGLGVWASNFQNSMANWIMTAHVDLGTRSDTGESNRSPITDMLPVLRVTRNCPRSFNMAVFDPDGDKVRCRVPTNSNTNECGLCGLTSGFSLDQPYRTTIAPLSKLPLQFTVYVDYHNAPSCLDGDYFPVFSSPTPRNGVNLPAYVNRTLEIKVKSEAQYTTIYDLIVTGPKGISKQKISTEEFIINWTPTENELNDHFPICFVSEARDTYYQVFQSEPRCVIVDVGSDETTVTCNETTITVEVEKSSLIRHNEGKLHLNDFSDASCNLTTRSNTTHLVAVMSLNTCGTTVEEDENNIIFKNMITSGDPTEIISRQNDVEIVFSCAYPKRSNLTLGFTHKNPYVFTEKGFGAFTFQFEFFQSQRFRKQIESSTYPVEVYLKQMIFMQIEATTSIPNTELFVESCKATPYDNPNSRISYTIIENGCVRDNTVEIYNSSKSQFRFGMEAFEFIGAHEQVYITCSVILCETAVLGSRCSQGCINSNSGNLRVKREAVAQSSRHTISQGPLHLAKTSDSQASGPSLNMGLNIIFIVGCLLACGVVIYRSRRSKAKYQPLPTFETD